VHDFTKTLAMEVANKGVTVNTSWQVRWNRWGSAFRFLFSI
jgi:hypothetical protein